VTVSFSKKLSAPWNYLVFGLIRRDNSSNMFIPHLLFVHSQVKDSRDSSVGIALGYGLEIGVLGFYSRWGLEIFLFTTASRTALEPTQPPIQWVPRALSLGVKEKGREADHSPPSSTEVKE
jgi:hypothetical protein